MNMGISDTGTTQQLLAWFDTIWLDDLNSKNIKQDLIEKLEVIAADQPANFIYF